MTCHECLMRGEQAQATALCRFCFVGLFKPHLVELYRDPPSVPQLTCRHQPAKSPPSDGWSQPVQAPAAQRVHRNGVVRERRVSRPLLPGAMPA